VRPACRVRLLDHGPDSSNLVKRAPRPGRPGGPIGDLDHFPPGVPHGGPKNALYRVQQADWPQAWWNHTNRARRQSTRGHHRRLPFGPHARLGEPATQRPRRTDPQLPLTDPIATTAGKDIVRTSFHTGFLIGIPVLEAISRIKDAGFDGVELNAETLPWAQPHILPDTPRSVIEQIARTEAVTSIAAHRAGLPSPDQARRDEAV
jgi:hypothetical protein